jgi:hypothetical protein
LEEFFSAYRDACSSLMSEIWSGFLKGDSSPVWRLVPSTNQLSGLSILLQPAEASARGASARGALESHLGWLSNDIKPRIHVLSRRLRRLVDKKPGAEQASLLASLNTLIHGLNAINSSKAWMKVGKDQETAIMKPAGSKKAVAAPIFAYGIASRMFIRASKGRSLPDPSESQAEFTRSGAKLRSTQIECSQEVLEELGISLESSHGSEIHPYWLRFAVHDSAADLSANFSTSILVPALGHRGFGIRNFGKLTSGAGGCGSKAFPLHPAGQHKGNKSKNGNKSKRSRQFNQKLQKNVLNPVSIRPEAVESIALVRKADTSGRISYFAGIRTQMGDAFKASKAAYAPLVEEVGLDWGIINLLTSSEEIGGAHFHGVRLLQGKVLPLLEKSIGLVGVRQTEKAALIAKKAKMLRAKDPALSSEEAELKAEEFYENFNLSTPRSIRLREKAQGILESFLGDFFNRIAAELRPAKIAVEKLDFRGSGLSPELNALLANSCRFFVEGKLKDLCEKFGIEIIRVEAAYTSQECSACGLIDSGNRKGEAFACLSPSCQHQERADLNASKSIKSRISLPSSSRLGKSKAGLAWSKGTLPMLPPELYKSMREAGIYHPRLLHALQNRKKESKESKAAKPDGALRAAAPILESVKTPSKIGGAAKELVSDGTWSIRPRHPTEEEAVLFAAQST